MSAAAFFLAKGGALRDKKAMPLTVWYEGRRLDLDARGPDGASRTLARLLWLEGPLPPRPLCGGLGRCGRCRVRFRSAPPAPAPSETRALSAAELGDAPVIIPKLYGESPQIEDLVCLAPVIRR